MIQFYLQLPIELYILILFAISSTRYSRIYKYQVKEIASGNHYVLTDIIDIN